MRILLLADLHFRTDWYRWVSAQNSDLTAIAGDLLDGFHPDGLLPQMVAFKQWVDGFGGNLALSSGNHDGNIEGGVLSGEVLSSINREAAIDILRHENWMDALERPGVVTDRRSQILETRAGNLVVTTIPFFPVQGGFRFCSALWDEGKRLHAASGAPWLVLHHEPPANTLVGGYSGEASLFYKIREYQPDFVLSGHIHGQPYSGAFADTIGKTWCFNPGVPVLSRAMKTKVPNHIVLDLCSRTATWHTTPNVGKRQPVMVTRSLQSLQSEK